MRLQTILLKKFHQIGLITKNFVRFQSTINENNEHSMKIYPLEGIRILDLTRIGNYANHFLFFFIIKRLPK